MKIQRLIVLISLFALMTTAPAFNRFWQVKDGIQQFDPKSLFNWQLLLVNQLENFEFGNVQDCMLADEGSIRIVDCQDQSGMAKWQSEETWNVTEALAADLNRDGRNELVMVVWRPFKPWPIDSFLPNGGRIKDFQDNKGMSCHLILVGWDGEKYREMWAGSSLKDPIFDIQAVDLDQDGNLELVAIEGKYNSVNDTGALTVWDWSGFGFQLRDRVEDQISGYGILSDEKNVMIITD